MQQPTRLALALKPFHCQISSTIVGTSGCIDSIESITMFFTKHVYLAFLFPSE